MKKLISVLLECKIESQKCCNGGIGRIIKISQNKNYSNVTLKKKFKLIQSQIQTYSLKFFTHTFNTKRTQHNISYSQKETLLLSINQGNTLWR